MSDNPSPATPAAQRLLGRLDAIAGLKDGASVRSVNALAPIPLQPEQGLGKDPAPGTAPAAKKS